MMAPRSGCGGGIAAVEDFGELAEEPRPAEAPASDDHAIAAGGAQHAQGVPALPDVAVAEHGYVEQGLELADRVPVGLARVELGRGARV